MIAGGSAGDVLRGEASLLEHGESAAGRCARPLRPRTRDQPAVVRPSSDVPLRVVAGRNRRSRFATCILTRFAGACNGRHTIDCGATRGGIRWPIRSWGARTSRGRQGAESTSSSSTRWRWTRRARPPRAARNGSSTVREGLRAYCVDVDSIVQCVRDRDVAWRAPGANHSSIGIEHAGRARQSRAEWDDPYSRAMLARSAALVANLCRKYKVPAMQLSGRPRRRQARRHEPQQRESCVPARYAQDGAGLPHRGLRAGRAGEAQGRKLPEPSDPLQPPPPVIRRGDTGWQVKRMQRFLRRHGLLPEPLQLDGHFGETARRPCWRSRRSRTSRWTGSSGR